MVVDADKSIKGDTIVIPGHKEKHNTVINVPGHDGVSQYPESYYVTRQVLSHMSDPDLAMCVYLLPVTSPPCFCLAIPRRPALYSPSLTCFPRFPFPRFLSRLFSRAAQQWPEKKSKLTVDINANPASKLTTALEMLQQHQKAHSGEVQKVSIKMPDVDLSKHMPAGKDVVRFRSALPFLYRPVHDRRSAVVMC